MAKFMLIVLVAAYINATLAQDMEPRPIEDYSTTTSSTTTTTTTPKTTTTIAPSTTPKITSTKPTIRLPLTTEGPLTEPTVTSTSPQPLENNEETTVPAITTAIPTNSWRPSWPVYPSYGNGHGYPNRRCYYKEKHGTPYLTWICGNLRYVYPVECYYCCYYEHHHYAACHRTFNSICENGH